MEWGTLCYCSRGRGEESSKFVTRVRIGGTVDTPSSSINPVPLLPSSSTTPQSPPLSSSSHVPQTQNLS
jgi:hypothetical protein